MRFGAVTRVIAAMGLPLAPLLLVLAMELMAGGSALVISGFKTRLGAILLLVFLVPTTLLFHGGMAVNLQRFQLFKNLAIIAVLLMVIDRHPA